ncbi:MAG: biopolymer transporter ExbD [Gemmatimonadota bacterium]|nr:biopolymer transporter ExbD [Gemmatimonadota bacterium]MDH3421421.1 biopolymer transporter ExbD [Gemmatimonadota bacterium]
MAVLNNKKQKVSDEVPTSSMADIAFLLLIFFLVTTTFPKDKGLAIVLPEQGETQEISQRNIIHLIIQPNGIVDVKRGESQQVQQVRAEQIEGLWRQAITDNPNLIAAVKTHPDAAYEYMVDVLDALHSANAERISLQVLEQ